MKIEETLMQFGCSQREVETFFALAKEGEGRSVLVLSKLLNSPRPTIYVHLKSLIEKGLVRRGIDDNGSVFYAETYEAIATLFNERAKQLKISGDFFLELGKKQKSPEYYTSKFFVHTSAKAAESILRDILRSREKETLWIWPIREMLSVVSEEVLASFNEERIERKMSARVIWSRKQTINPKSMEKSFGSLDEKKSLRKIRIAPKEIDMTLGYCIYGNKVGFLSGTREHYGFIIDSKELAENLRGQFEYLWKRSKKFEGK